MAMLAAGLISSSGFDLWAMLKRWNQRRRYRDVVASGYDPFTGRLRTTKKVDARQINKTAAQKQLEEKTRRLRYDISRWIAQRNLSAAAKVYLELIKLDNKQILPRQQLLDIANQLASENKSAESAQAYEQFLANYPNYEYANQVELMLGILYCRYLNQPDLAIKHLNSAAKKLSDPSQLKMCQDELSKLQK